MAVVNYFDIALSSMYAAGATPDFVHILCNFSHAFVMCSDAQLLIGFAIIELALR